MSTIKADNIANRTGSLTKATSSIIWGSAAAWVVFNGTTNVGGNCDVLNSHNVSSVSDLGVGEYQINFSSALASPDYCVTGMPQRSGTNDDVNIAIKFGTTPTTTALRIAARTSSSGATQDPSRVCVAVFVS